MKDKNIGIYSITNVINGKRYIGQSTNLKERMRRHTSRYKDSKSHTYDYPIYRAMRKYGLEYFDLQVLEYCDAEKLNEREIYWIGQYDTLNNGYNQTWGGSSCKATKLDGDKLSALISELEDDKLTHKEIAAKYGVSKEMVDGINTGRHWHHDREYPIRKKKVSPPKIREKKKQKEICPRFCAKCGEKLIGPAKYCRPCYLETLEETVPSRDDLLNDILTMSMVQIGKKYGVSDNAVRKWLNKRDLPTKYDDIKKLRESLK